MEYNGNIKFKSTLFKKFIRGGNKKCTFLEKAFIRMHVRVIVQ